MSKRRNKSNEKQQSHNQRKQTPMQNARMQVLRTMNVFHAVFHGRKNEVSLRVNGLDVKGGAVLTGFALGAYLAVLITRTPSSASTALISFE